MLSMKRRVVICTPFVLAPALLALVGEPGCSSTPKAVGLSAGCSLNSDCNSPLVCVFSLCHEACAQSRDCPNGQSCVAVGADNVCTLPGESSCADAGKCSIDTLTCDPASKQCLNPCTAAGCPVAEQTCQGGVCQDPPGDGGADASPQGDGTVSDGTSGDGASGPDGDSSSSFDVGPPADAGPLGFVASNLPPGTVTSAATDGGDGGPPSAMVSVSCSDSENFCPLYAPVTIQQNDGTPASLYVLSGLTIGSSATLTLADPNPVIIAVLGPVNIYGAIEVAAGGTLGVAGGFSSGVNLGPGGGGLGTGEYQFSGGGGASYCGIGGAGLPSSGMYAAPGGAAYGTQTITPLLGGSAGGGEGGNFGGGGGGGAIQILSSTSITIGGTGLINAGGAGGVDGNQAGGGSGGAILLEAPTVTVAGTLAANGGGAAPREPTPRRLPRARPVASTRSASSPAAPAAQAPPSTAATASSTATSRWEEEAAVPGASVSTRRAATRTSAARSRRRRPRRASARACSEADGAVSCAA
jgi:hypothetical protein